MHIHNENIKNIPGLVCLLLILSGGYAILDRGLFFMSKRRVLSEGDVFNKLTVISEAPPHITKGGETKRKILCRCECGTIKPVWLHSLTTGHVKSCGCLVTKHGDSHTKLHKVWCGMIERCQRKKHAAYSRYGGRGIFVSSDWLDFRVFKKWALNNGYSPELQLDRIDNDGPYSESNCRFTTAVINYNNRSTTMIVSYKGRRIAFGLLLRENGLIHEYSAIKNRVKIGWDLERAMFTPIIRKPK